MLLHLQKFNLKGKEMFLADTLSRVHPTEVHLCNFAQELEEIDHAASTENQRCHSYRSCDGTPEGDYLERLVAQKVRHL